MLQSLEGKLQRYLKNSTTGRDLLEMVGQYDEVVDAHWQNTLLHLQKDPP